MSSGDRELAQGAKKFLRWQRNGALLGDRISPSFPRSANDLSGQGKDGMARSSHSDLDLENGTGKKLIFGNVFPLLLRIKQMSPT